jgi:phage FluMu protein Com
MAEEAQPGDRECLRCDRTFASWDTRWNKICPKCTKLNERTYVRRTYSTRSCPHEDGGPDGGSS